MVTSPATHLGGKLEQLLPWLFLAGGIVLSGAAGFFVAQLSRRRHNAETDAQTISALYNQLDDLYSDQRTIAETLQHALLPQRNPLIPGLAIATRYVAGAEGVDIGGDWFSIIALDEHHFGFVVGDVSGRGVDAASLMARVRFTLRAYLAEGHAPHQALELCARQVDITEDGHMVTALVGVADMRTREVTFANAGHPNPILISGADVQFASTEPGPPLGVAVGPYEPTTVQMPAGSTLLAFTDGLIERRDEDIDVGLNRLARAAKSEPESTSLDNFVAEVLATMVGTNAEDDIAVLAFRWVPGR